MQKKIGMCFGTFDLLHPGHLYFLNEAKQLVDYLIVIIARDATVEHIKGRKPIYTEGERMGKLQTLPIVDEVILGSLSDKYEAIRKIQPSTIILGYDQEAFVDALYQWQKTFDFPIQIIRMTAHKEHIYKSSLMREKCEVESR